MASIKKLPSGNWWARVYSHTENGKKIYESFTAPTRREAELKAAEYANHGERKNIGNLTVIEALDGYINAKRNVLSPSTIRGYERMKRNNYKKIEKTLIKKLTSESLQLFVSDLSQSCSPKSVSNIYGLLSSALAFYMPSTTFRVTLPHKVKKKLYSPSNEDVQVLFKSAAPELQKCIALGAYGGLRRGEISALTYSDLNGNVLNIDKDIVQETDGTWVLKQFPKTDDSVREIILPNKVVKLLGSGNPDERIIKYQNPGSITQCFTKLRNRLGIDIHFHLLRHFYASIGAVLGIPPTTLSEFGGWSKSSKIMQSTYQNSIKSVNQEYAEKMQKYFDDLMDE